MKLNTHLVIQALLMIIQAGNAFSTVAPPNAQKYVALIVGLAQAGLAWYNHNFNPDGTPAEVSYQKK
jgi:hypothetical protein